MKKLKINRVFIRDYELRSLLVPYDKEEIEVTLEEYVLIQKSNVLAIEQGYLYSLRAEQDRKSIADEDSKR